MNLKSLATSAAAVVFSLACLCPSAVAAPLNPDQALGLAKQELADRAGTRSALPLDYSLMYTASLNGRNDLYVFADNKAGAFTIVSADSRIPVVLGYSFDSGFDPDNIPCNLRWWLDQYADQIDCFLAADPADVPATRSIVDDSNRKYIAPFIKTKWDQMAPYNNETPTENGRHTPTGCVATAMAQAMKYYNWPPKGQGSRQGFDLERTFNWDLMLDEYPRNGYTPEQAAAVASLMLCCGRSVDMMYSSWASGASANRQQYALPTYFDYSPDVRFISRDYYSQAEWDDIIYAEVAAGRPVLYGGQATGGGHAFICDGYSEDGYFHINWGWSGMSDGFFLLNALAPSANGTGGFEGGYNTHQTAIINIKKNDGQGQMQSLLLSERSFIYRDGFFRAASSGNVIFYNALEAPVNIYIGIRAVDSQGNVIDIFDPELSEIQGFYGFPGYSIEMPRLPDGQYKLYGIYKTDENEQTQFIGIPYGAQQYVELTVNGNDYAYSNPGVPEDMVGQVVCSDIDISPYASCDVNGNFFFYVSNIGPGDYSGKLNLRILDSSQSLVIELSKTVDVPARTSQLVTMSTVLDIPEGNYTAIVEDSRHNALTPAAPFTVGTALKAGKTSDSPLLFTITSPGYATTVSPTVSCNLVNSSKETVTQEIVLNVMNADGSTVITSGRSNPLSVPGNYRNTFNFNGFELVKEPGDYVLQISNVEGETLSDPFPIKIVGAPFYVQDYQHPGNDLFFSSTDADNVIVAHPQGGQYGGSVVIGGEVEEGKRVSGIAGNAFIFASSLEELTLPSTIERIGSAVFYKADRLRLLHIDAPVPPSISSNALPAVRYPQVTLDVPEASANLYKRTDIWSRFDIPGWQLALPADVSVLTGLEKDNDDAVYNPYYTSVGKPLTFRLQEPRAGLVYRIDITMPSGQTRTLVSENGEITLPALSSGLGEVSITAADPAGVEEVEQSSVAAVYDIHGRLIKREAAPDDLRRLPSGIYIFGHKPVMIP